MSAPALRPRHDTERYPIRTVAALTGVNAVTLRAWERRYGLIKPARTPKGHRLYTRADIARIHRITAALERGVAIGHVRAALGGSPADQSAQAQADPWRAQRQRMLGAIVRFDEYGLEDTLNEIQSLYPGDLVVKNLVLPLLEDLGRRWETAEGTVAEEHFFGVFLRNKLGARFHHRARRREGPKLLATCLQGEAHEIGLLLFALAAHEAGYRVVLLGADMPLSELPRAVKRSGVEALVLSSSIDPSEALLGADLRRLVESVEVPVIVGGKTAVTHYDAIARAGAHPIGSDIPIGLDRLAEILAQRS